MQIRKVEPHDSSQWAEMRLQLWPSSKDGYKSEIDAYFSGNPIGLHVAFVMEHDNEGVIAFIEINIRNCVEGTLSSAVPYVEGWYVLPQHRGQGIGKQLMKFTEEWALENGYCELASDADLHNLISIDAHKRLGFDEVARSVCFYKKLNRNSQ